MDSELVAGPDGELVELVTPAEPTPVVDPRILGTYDGDGSQICIRKMKPPPVLPGIMLTLFMYLATMISLTIMEYLLNPQSSKDGWKTPALIISGVVAGLWLVCCLNKFRHYIYAHFRYGATPTQATYWMKNSQLRRNCRKPHDADEFFELVKLAEAADHSKAQAYVANEIVKIYHHAIITRGLGEVEVDETWLRDNLLRAGMPDGPPLQNTPPTMRDGIVEQEL